MTTNKNVVYLYDDNDFDPDAIKAIIEENKEEGYYIRIQVMKVRKYTK